ncbi:MAG TPA: hypothetical protein VEU06_11730 [Micropepsaceae bacterium]|nr:hypothetical protein [Micropepsaceae bacterium]
MELSIDPYASEPWCAYPRARVRLSELERAIYSTIAYRDVFDFAPSIDEIHRYLHWVKCEREDVVRVLSRGPLSELYLTTDGRYFALKGREHILGLRPRRRALAETRWPLALHYARFLANLPHVRMVGLTGSFAADNFSEGGDIDFILLTDADAMWRARALARTAALFSRKFGTNMLCPNIFLSMTTLALERESLYDAHELAQIVPLFGRTAYDELRRKNRWSESYLPNSEGAPEICPQIERLSSPKLKGFVEWGSNSPLGRWIEALEAARNMRRFNRGDRFKGWTLATRERHSLRESMKLDIEKAWRRRLDAFEAAEA